MDIDNLTYQFGLSERLKQRVDTFGHVFLDDDHATKLAGTKAMCSLVSMVSMLYLVYNAAAIGTMQAGGVAAFVFKVSEVFTRYKTMSRQELAFFVATTYVLLQVQLEFFQLIVDRWYADS